jgi:AraC-like DNA-binding protein/mannose-6-phosphate isomerase-like protein (cupin superfamily)
MRYFRPDGLLSGFMAGDTTSVTPELIHAGEQWVPKTFEIQTHQHECWELYYQAHGETTWSTHDETYLVAQGGFLAMPPGIVHALEQKQTSKHHFLFAAIDVGIALKRMPALSGCWNTDKVQHADNASSVEAPFRQLIREVTLDLPMRSEAISRAIDSLLIEAARSLSRKDLDRDKPAALPFIHPSVLRAKELIDLHPADKWNMSDLAGMVGLSASHFSERFLKDIGMSPFRYLAERRLALAKDLLLTTDLAVTTIGLDLGFASSQHFAGAFRKHTGQTPSHFRALERRSRNK